MAQLFVNNGYSTLSAAIGTGDTTLFVASGHGSRFPVVASPDYCYVTLEDAAGNIEIVKVTAHTSGNTSMTVVRAQQGTTARSWAIGDLVELRATAAEMTAWEGMLTSKADVSGETYTGAHDFSGASGVTLPAATSIGNVSAAEVAHLDGVTSAIQTQINAKAAKAGDIYTGTHDMTGATVTVATAAPGATGNAAASLDYVNAQAFSATLPGYTGNALKVLRVNAGETSAEWASGLPTGMVAPYAGASAPDGWLLCDGATVSRTTYSELFSVIGVIYGAGDGSTTFKLPDLRGEFVRGLDAGRGVDVGRSLGSSQSSQNASHNHGGSTSSNGAHTHTTGTYSNVKIPGVSGTVNSPLYISGGEEAAPGPLTHPITANSNGAHTHTISSDGGGESRPRNVAMNYIIKT